MKRWFILAGFTALVLMLPLALTSTGGWIRRMGLLRWQRLHWLVYITAIAASLLLAGEIRYSLASVLRRGYSGAAWIKTHWPAQQNSYQHCTANVIGLSTTNPRYRNVTISTPWRKTVGRKTGTVSYFRLDCGWQDATTFLFHFVIATRDQICRGYGETTGRGFDIPESRG